MYVLTVLGVLLAVGLPSLWFASRRFERRRIAEGEWNEAGPTHPSRTPRKERRNRFGNGLAFDIAHGLDRDADWPGGKKPGRSEDVPPPPNDR